ncbi:hypothetical protein [Zooshikella harenae]|uniref:Transcriptional regulator SutA RNAP-binding domain-containing protein n=1 Tax=Zooshikella harenae TaxID=2827238 RepID=A0ABS5ZJ45_9GAMM|nr:hypothetical protein [Zooshikella harenae]MBU2713908.1 hypothetical protein [Zooshikella harenae]
MSRKKVKANDVIETHQSIDAQVDEFLKSGGKITQVPRGVSGKPSIGKDHTMLAKK